MSKKHELLNIPICIGAIYPNGMSRYRVESRDDDCLRPSLHLRRLTDGWEIDVVGAALYLTDRGVELKWDYSKNGRFVTMDDAAEKAATQEGV